MTEEERWDSGPVFSGDSEHKREPAPDIEDQGELHRGFGDDEETATMPAPKPLGEEDAELEEIDAGSLLDEIHKGGK